MSIFVALSDWFWRKAGLPIQRAILPEEVEYLTKSHIALGFIRQALPFEPAGGESHRRR